MTDAKTVLRRHALERRDLIVSGEAHAASDKIAARGLELAQRLAPAGGVVSAYWPIRSEVSTRPLLDRLARAGFRTALPVVIGAGKPLQFRAWSPGDDLAKGPIGLSQPLAEAATVEPDLVFLPLACFDAQGNRIGYGAGYYDATLAALRSKKKIVAVGLAFADQEVAAIPHEPHDQRLDFVITENGLFDFGVLG